MLLFIVDMVIVFVEDMVLDSVSDGMILLFYDFIIVLFEFFGKFVDKYVCTINDVGYCIFMGIFYFNGF